MKLISTPARFMGCLIAGILIGSLPFTALRKGLDMALSGYGNDVTLNPSIDASLSLIGAFVGISMAMFFWGRSVKKRLHTTVEREPIETSAEN